MTNKEFYKAVMDGNVTQEVMDKAATLYEKQCKRSNKRAEENEPIKAEILVYLEGRERTFAKEIADAIGHSTQKASALVEQLVKSGDVVVLEKAKKSDAKSYALAE